MAGLCEGGNEPPGSLKASTAAEGEEKTGPHRSVVRMGACQHAVALLCLISGQNFDPLPAAKTDYHVATCKICMSVHNNFLLSRPDWT
ncbi:hypothetical protein ANN_11952 [Periplaneta americana]|uniref:Uncharacterized protein n=1 Tax=Periplaneta americana TaxID=6978 RepID=A0ABQ8T7L4_PERAM|nr:hypothetical protein ANN_11952 [Periplaneta americana]